MIDSLTRANIPHNKKYFKSMIFALLFVVASCDLINPIKQVDCKTTKHSPGLEKVFKDPSFIINTKTGEEYTYDIFSGKLKLMSDGGERAARNNSWNYKNDTIYPDIAFRKTTYMEFKPMEYFSEHKKLDTKSNSWETLSSSEGKCWWGKLRTTEIQEK